MNNKIFLKKFIRKVEWEAIYWLAGLIYLLFINPYKEQHFTLCPFRNIGISFCPGCGLGKSISFVYHLDFINSLQTHPLGIFALILISYRIIILIKRTINNFNQKENLWQMYMN